MWDPYVIGIVCFFVDKFIVEHSFDVFCKSFLYSVSKISILLFVKSRIVELAT